MCNGNWRDNPRQLVYQHPYDDSWGVLHDPTSEWDRLLKYYKLGVILLVEEGTRRMARPASTQAQAIIRSQKRHHLQNLVKTQALEAEDLKRVSDIKHWKRRKKRKSAARHKVRSYTHPYLSKNLYSQATSSA